ncbi:hypothetical protein DFH06DRAFT_1205846 [Mycena polygramma]|nr:hypothetical protein DFH06DRAFT_1205846 [Mycena polygramma]
MLPSPGVGISASLANAGSVRPPLARPLTLQSYLHVPRAITRALSRSRAPRSSGKPNGGDARGVAGGTPRPPSATSRAATTSGCAARVAGQERAAPAAREGCAWRTSPAALVDTGGSSSSNRSFPMPITAAVGDRGREAASASVGSQAYWVILGDRMCKTIGVGAAARERHLHPK